MTVKGEGCLLIVYIETRKYIKNQYNPLFV